MTRWATKAIVLRSEAAGESDRRVILLTPDQGRLSALAKGAGKSLKRFAGLFDRFELLSVGLMIAPRTNRVMIEHASAIEMFPRFRENYLHLARASLLLEIAETAMPENQPAALIFKTLAAALSRLHSEPDRDRWAVVYAYRLLDLAGYRPELSRCVRCPCPSTPEMLFSPAAGGLLCPACSDLIRNHSPREAAGLTLAPDTRAALAALLSAPDSHLPRYRLSTPALDQAKLLLARFTDQQLEKPLRSLAFLVASSP